MDRPITDRQFDVLAVIAAHILAHKVSPTMTEIAKNMGFSSPNAAQEHVSRLEKKGFIAKYNQSQTGRRLSRSMSITDKGQVLLNERLPVGPLCETPEQVQADPVVAKYILLSTSQQQAVSDFIDGLSLQHAA